MDNPWRWRQDHNPYRVNAFAVLRVTPGTATLRELRRKAGSMRRLLQYSPEQATVAGQPLTEADIAAAQQRLTTPADRLAEEMLCHRPQPDASKRFTVHMTRFERSLTQEVGAAVPLITRPEAIIAYLRSAPRPFAVMIPDATDDSEPGGNGFLL